MYYPVFFIEPTNVCNLSCPMCPTNNEMCRSKGYMKLADFKSFIDEMETHFPHSSKYLNIWGWGEPLLNADIYEMIKLASQKRFVSRISSNFNFEAHGNIDKILGSDLSVLIIGLDGLDEETYRAYRKNGDLIKVIDNIRELQKRKKQYNTFYPIVVISTLVTKKSISNINAIKDFCEKESIDALMLKSPNLWRAGKTDLQVNTLYKEFILPQVSFSRYDEGITSLGNKGICPFLKMNGVILWDGSISTCCYDYNGENLIVENEFTENYKSFLNNRENYKLWNMMKKREFSICSSCDGNATRRKWVLFNKNANLIFYLKYL